jgi:hypothetical protein
LRLHQGIEHFRKLIFSALGEVSSLRKNNGVRAMVSRRGGRIVIFLPGFRDLATGLPVSCSKSVQRCEAYIKTIVDFCASEKAKNLLLAITGVAVRLECTGVLK